MKKTCIQCNLKTNRFQMQYLKHHILSTRRVFISVCRTLDKEQALHKLRTAQEMKGLCKQSHRDYIKIMDERELMALVHDLLHYQWCLHNQKGKKPSTFFTCVVSEHTMIWRNLSLKSMLPNEHRRALSQGEFLYARMQAYPYHIQLRMYLALRTKS